MAKDFNIFNRLFGNSVNFTASSKAKEKRKRSRTCRIEELEGREMLSATPFDANHDIEPMPLSPFVEYQYQSSGDADDSSSPFLPMLEANVAFMERCAMA